ncbi:MAG TPA: hypothetical protein VNO30_29895 [Kofleriaceae bacterium]|nr:hypothetical protein [Kofleriaceae bacterium]
MRVRWVIAGTFAVIGLYWLTVMVLFSVGVRSDWMRYGTHVLAALAGGALMVAHAPLRPWREPAAAGTLAVVLLWVQRFGSAHQAFKWLELWPVALGVAALSGALAAAGGLVARRFAVTAQTGLIIVLSAGVGIGVFAAVVRMTDFGWVLSSLLGMLGGGFVTQAVVASRRPVACGAGGAVCMALWQLGDGFTAAFAIASLVALPLLGLVGYLGAVLAWRTLRNGDAPSVSEVPPARLS